MSNINKAQLFFAVVVFFGFLLGLAVAGFPERLKVVARLFDRMSWLGVMGYSLLGAMMYLLGLYLLSVSGDFYAAEATLNVFMLASMVFACVIAYCVASALYMWLGKPEVASEDVRDPLEWMVVPTEATLDTDVKWHPTKE